MKKLLSIIAVSIFALGIMIIGRPITDGQYKGEDFFIINYGDDSDVLHGLYYKDGHIKGWNQITKEKAEEMFRKWELEQRKKTSI